MAQRLSFKPTERSLIIPMMVNEDNIRAVQKAITDKQTRGFFCPTVFVLEPTSNCNLSCVMCPNGLMPDSDLGEMSLVNFQKTIDKISPYCEFLMLYWMGESTLHQHFSEILHYARKKIKGRIVLSSNMTFQCEKITKSIAKNVDIALCCIDRWNERKYENIRRGAKFDSVVKNTKNLLKLSLIHI